jgi:hypothetical protein
MLPPTTVTVRAEGLMDHEDLAAVRPAYRLLRSKLAELDRARDRLQELIDGFEGLYPALAREEDGDETPETVTEQPAAIEQATPDETPIATEIPAPEPLPVHDTAPPTDGYIPRGKGAVVMVLSEAPGHWFSAQEVLTAMSQRGWTPKSGSPEQALSAVRTALGRATRDGRIESRPRDGRSFAYRFPPTAEPAEVEVIPSVT